MRYYVYIFVLVFCGVYSGCSSPNKPIIDSCEKSHSIDLSAVKYENTSAKLSDFVEEISYIPLSDKKLLKDIVQLYMDDNQFFIRCNNDPSVYIFSNEGNYIKPLFVVGNGPGETVCNSVFSCNEEKRFVSFNSFNSIYYYTYAGEFINKEKSTVNDRYKKVIGYQDSISFYQLSNVPPQKGELCNPNGDYLLYGENVNNNKVVYRYDNYGKNEKAEYRGVIAELESSDFVTGKLKGNFWFKHLYTDTLFVFDRESSGFIPEYIFNLGDNPWDYKTFVHLYYLDKEYITSYKSKTLLKEMFLGENYLIYKMNKGEDEGVGVYSFVDNKNLCFTNRYINDLDGYLNSIDLNSILSNGFCDGKYLYLPVSSYLFFEDDSTPFSSKLTAESNPVILKMKLK